MKSAEIRKGRFRHNREFLREESRLREDLHSSSILSDSRGMALILTLLVVTILTAMVVEFSYGVYINTSALHNWQTAQRLSVAGKSSIRFGARLVSENTSLLNYTYPGHLEISQKIPFEEIDGTVHLRIEDENSKFNLNSLVGENGILNTDAAASLLRLLTALGIKTEVRDRIIDWIDPDKEQRLHDSENSAKNGHLDSIDELLLIPGLDAETFEKMRPFVTIYGTARNETALININSAEIPVLMSLSDSISRDMAERIIQFRTSTPFERETDIFQIAGFDSRVVNPLLTYITVKGRAFNFRSTAQSGKIKRVIDAVIEISGNSRTVRYWKEY
jgi:general secretion pathway protein K